MFLPINSRQNKAPCSVYSIPVEGICKSQNTDNTNTLHVLDLQIYKLDRDNTYNELIISIRTIRNFCLLGTLSLQVSGIGRNNIIRSVVVLKNPFISATNLIETQYPYVIVISQAFAIGWQRKVSWNIKTIVYNMIKKTRMYTTT
jgi:hypothetical protein